MRASLARNPIFETKLVSIYIHFNDANILLLKKYEYVLRGIIMIIIIF